MFNFFHLYLPSARSAIFLFILSYDSLMESRALASLSSAAVSRIPVCRDRSAVWWRSDFGSRRSETFCLYRPLCLEVSPTKKKFLQLLKKQKPTWKPVYIMLYILQKCMVCELPMKLIGSSCQCLKSVTRRLTKSERACQRFQNWHCFFCPIKIPMKQSSQRMCSACVYDQG
jgi:hypothetical protein